MDPLTIAAASGLRSRMESLELLANNIANTATAGFKADREFYNQYVSAEAAAGESETGIAASISPDIQRHWTDFSSGTLTPTGNTLDLALTGKGFFQVQGADASLYTRNGSFRLSKSGQLETQEGYPVQSSKGKAIQLDPTKEIEITGDGLVRQGGQDVAQIAVMNVKDLSGLSKRGQAYFQINRSDLQAEAVVGSGVAQGKLESANVPTAEAAVQLVSVMRQFEMLQKAVGIGADMNRQTVEEVAKVSA